MKSILWGIFQLFFFEVTQSWQSLLRHGRGECPQLFSSPQAIFWNTSLPGTAQHCLWECPQSIVYRHCATLFPPLLLSISGHFRAMLGRIWQVLWCTRRWPGHCAAVWSTVSFSGTCFSAVAVQAAWPPLLISKKIFPVAANLEITDCADQICHAL